MGVSQAQGFVHYPRVLHRARWSALAARHVLRRVVSTPFAPPGELIGGLDDTIERRRGEPLTATGLSRAPVRSSHAPRVQASGRRWLGCMVVVKVTWAGAVWGWPVLTVLGPSER